MKNAASRCALWLLAVAGACQQAEKPPAANPGGSPVPVTARVGPATRPSPPAPAPPDSVQLLRPFVPAGYQVLFTVAGDLNRDAWPDRVAVLDTLAEPTDSTSDDDRFTITQLRRPLLLLLGEPGGARYRLAARNLDVVNCRNCAGAMGGDPFQQVVVKKGYFSVESAGGSAWRWFKVTTFRYDPADQHWYLHRVGQENSHVMTPDSVCTSVVTLSGVMT